MATADPRLSLLLAECCRIRLAAASARLCAHQRPLKLHEAFKRLRELRTHAVGAANLAFGRVHVRSLPVYILMGLDVSQNAKVHRVGVLSLVGAAANLTFAAHAGSMTDVSEDTPCVGLDRSELVLGPLLWELPGGNARACAADFIVQVLFDQAAALHELITRRLLTWLAGKDPGDSEAISLVLEAALDALLAFDDFNESIPNPFARRVAAAADPLRRSLEDATTHSDPPIQRLTTAVATLLPDPTRQSSMALPMRNLIERLLAQEVVNGRIEPPVGIRDRVPAFLSLTPCVARPALSRSDICNTVTAAIVSRFRELHPRLRGPAVQLPAFFALWRLGVRQLEVLDQLIWETQNTIVTFLSKESDSRLDDCWTLWRDATRLCDGAFPQTLSDFEADGINPASPPTPLFPLYHLAEMWRHLRLMGLDGLFPEPRQKGRATVLTHSHEFLPAVLSGGIEYLARTLQHTLRCDDLLWWSNGSPAPARRSPQRLAAEWDIVGFKLEELAPVAPLLVDLAERTVAPLVCAMHLHTIAQRCMKARTSGASAPSAPLLLPEDWLRRHLGTTPVEATDAVMAGPASRPGGVGRTWSQAFEELFSPEMPLANRFDTWTDSVVVSLGALLELTAVQVGEALAASPAELPSPRVLVPLVRTILLNLCVATTPGFSPDQGVRIAVRMFRLLYGTDERTRSTGRVVFSVPPTLDPDLPVADAYRDVVLPHAAALVREAPDILKAAEATAVASGSVPAADAVLIASAEHANRIKSILTAERTLPAVLPALAALDPSIMKLHDALALALPPSWSASQDSSEGRGGGGATSIEHADPTVQLPLPFVLAPALTTASTAVAVLSRSPFGGLAAVHFTIRSDLRAASMRVLRPDRTPAEIIYALIAQVCEGGIR